MPIIFLYLHLGHIKQTTKMSNCLFSGRNSATALQRGQSTFAITFNLVDTVMKAIIANIKNIF